MFHALILLVSLSSTAHAGDKDKDGISNKIDACKEEPEDMDGFEDEDGCPDDDNDKDGVMDTKDKCPDEAEDKDGFEDGDGCPDPDNDNDGVLDGDDQCPNELEDKEAALDGCPEASLNLITGDGWMPAINDLGTGLSAVSAKKAEGCVEAAGTIESWLKKNDPAMLKGVFEARIERNETFTLDRMSKLVDLKVQVYEGHREAVDIFCAEHPAYSKQAKVLDGKLKPLLAPPVK